MLHLAEPGANGRGRDLNSLIVNGCMAAPVPALNARMLQIHASDVVLVAVAVPLVNDELSARRHMLL
jgi:hypothetical protein